MRLIGWEATRASTSWNQARKAPLRSAGRKPRSSADRRRFATLIAAKEDPIAAADRDAADRPFGCLILDLQVPVFTVAGQRRQFLACFSV
jgi:hypothetical protein